LLILSYGIVGPTLSWIEDFLLNRSQKVLINGAGSEWENVTSGIPQDSVLGPILFVIYINDLPDTCLKLQSIYPILPVTVVKWNGHI
jgi:hypothetical protein